MSDTVCPHCHRSYDEPVAAPMTKEQDGVFASLARQQDEAHARIDRDNERAKVTTETGGV